MKVTLPCPMALVPPSLTSLTLVQGSFVLAEILAKISALLDSGCICLNPEYQREFQTAWLPSALQLLLPCCPFRQR